MRWFSSPVIGVETPSLCANVRLALLCELVMKRFDFHEPVLLWFSRIRERRGGKMVLFSGDLGLTCLPCVRM